MEKEQVFGKKSRPSEVSVSSGSKFLGATFLYMLIALVITGGVAAICGLILNKAIMGEPGSEAAINAFFPVLLVSLVMYIPTLIWVQVSALRNGKTMVPAYIIYSVIMGVFLSSFTAFIEYYYIAIAFGLTCLAFAIMALIAWTSKKNLSSLAVIASGLISGALIIWLVYWLFSLFTLTPMADMAVSLIVTYAIFIAIILITIVDLNNVKRIASNGVYAKNVALLCAFNLYVDFIYIFIRILALVIRFRRN